MREGKLDYGRALQGTWMVLDGLFVARVDVSLASPVGVSTSYWTYKVEDVGPRLITRARWLTVYAQERDAARKLFEHPPSAQIEAELFHRKLAAHLGQGIKLEVELGRDPSGYAERAAHGLMDWLVNRSGALVERERRAGLEPGSEQAFIHGDNERGWHKLTVKPDGAEHYRANVSTTLRASAQIAGQGRDLAVNASAGDGDLVRALEAVRFPTELVDLKLGVEINGGRLVVDVDGPRDWDLGAAIDFVHSLLTLCDRLAFKRVKEAERRASGTISAPAADALVDALAAGTDAFAARTGEGRVEVRLVHESLGLTGLLRADALDLDVAHVTLRLEAALPPGPAYKLRASRGGIVDWVLNQFDPKAGHDKLDDGYLLEAEEAGLLELAATASAWLQLGSARAQVERRQLSVDVELPTERAQTVARALVDLWLRLASRRGGSDG